VAETDIQARLPVGGPPISFDAPIRELLNSLASVDEALAAHVRDMHRLFELGDPPNLDEPERDRHFFIDLNDKARAVVADARVVTGEFRLINATENYSSMAVRVLALGQDIVVGPFYTYETLELGVLSSLQKLASSS
jgi:hypothetical protein